MTTPEQKTDEPFEPEAPQHPSGCPMALPNAVAWFGPRFRQEDRRRVYRELREEHGAVVPIVLPDGPRGWLVVGYRELQQVVTSPEVYSPNAEHWNQWPLVSEDWPLMPMVGRADSLHAEVGDRYKHRVGVVNDSLEAIAPVELRRVTERCADRLIDRFCTRGTADLITEYAQQLPALVLGILLGLSEDGLDPLVRDINALIASAPDAVESQQRVKDALDALLQQRAQEPLEDVTTRFLQHPYAEEFSDKERVEDLFVVLVAGHQPTSDWIGNSLRLMLVDDWFSASLTGGRRSVAEAMNEVLWEDPPTQSVCSFFALRDAQLAGKAITKGDLMVVSYAGANTDPGVRPEGTELTGTNSAYMSFGYGSHPCPYSAQEAAREIARTCIEVLLDRLPDTDLAVEHSQLVWRPTPIVRGLQTLPVSFTPSSPLAG